MKPDGLSVLVLEKARKKFGEPEEASGEEEKSAPSFAISEASQKVHAAFKGDDANALGQALGEFFDIYSSKSKS